MSSALAARGTLLAKGSGTSTTAIGEITRCAPAIQVKEAEVTNLNASNQHEEYIPTSAGVLINFGINFIPTTHETSILNNVTSGVTAAYTIQWSDSTVATSKTAWTFNGYFLSLDITGERDGALVGDGQMRASGTINWSA